MSDLVRRRWAEWLANQKWVPYRLRRIVYSRRLRPLIWRTSKDSWTALSRGHEDPNR